MDTMSARLATPSLERLKTLNTISFEEAKHLCNHPSRADMIAKWAFGKLKTNGVPDLDTWMLLLHCLRLLSPERIGALLVSHDIVACIEGALNHADAPHDILVATADVLQFLLDLSKDAYGSPVEAALRTSAASAASFLGSWLRVAHTFFSDDSIVVEKEARTGLFSPAIQIWNMREHQADENQLFAHHCLLPVADLLEHEAIGDEGGRTKRKRSGEKLLRDQDGRELLETLLARHIFAAGRMAFWKEPGRPHAIINELLKPLQEGHQRPSVLPSLLDIALRCSSTSTLRQRTKEGPWVEALFQAILAYASDDTGNITDLSILAQLLLTVQRYTSLSRDTLKRLYDRHVNLDNVTQAINGEDAMLVDTPGSESHALTATWALVAEFVASDRDILDEAALRSILSTIAENRKHHEPNQRLLEQNILIPAMTAFAKRRDLTTFMEIWRQHADFESLANHFSELVEESLTDHVYLQQLQKYHILVDDMTCDEAEYPALRMTFAVADALLAGIKTRYRQDMIFLELDGFFNLLLELATKTGVWNSAAGTRLTSKAAEEDREDQKRHRSSDKQWINEASFWKLLHRVFEMWFPSWISQKYDQKLICAKGRTWLNTGPVQTALSVIYEKDAQPTLSHAAGLFVVSICHAFSSQGCGCDLDCRQPALDIVESLILDQGALVIDIMPRQPDLLGSLRDDVIRMYFAKSLDQVFAAARENRDVGRTQSLLEASQSLGTSIISSGRRKTVASFIDVLIQQLRLVVENSDEEDAAVREAVMLSVLCDLSPSMMTREDREKLINTLFKNHITLQNRKDRALSNLRLALLIKLMEVPNATSALSTDANALWQLAQSSIQSDSDDTDGVTKQQHSGRRHNFFTSDIEKSLERKATPNLLDELVQLTVGHLLATQEQERSEAVLVSIGEQIKIHIQSMQMENDLKTSAPKMQLIKALVPLLEAGRRKPLKDRLAFLDPETLGPYYTLLVKHAWNSDFVKDRTHAGITTEEWFHLALETLMTAPHDLMPDIAIETINVEADTVVARLLESLDAASGKTEGHVDDVESSLRYNYVLSALVCKYCIGCRFNDPGRPGEYFYAASADDILRLPIPPVERRTLFESFAGFVQPMSNRQKIEIAKILLKRSEGYNASTLQLVDIFLSQVDDSIDADWVLSNARQLVRDLLQVFAEDRPSQIRQGAARCVMTVLKRKSFIMNQYLVERTLEGILAAVALPATSSSVYMAACSILAALFLQYRPRLRGRYHLVVKVLQSMMSMLFQGKFEHESSDANNACVHRLTRLLILFCELPHAQRQTKTTSLVDEARKEQTYAGQFARHVLHHYCAQVLARTPADGLREALTPALWSIIEAMEINEADGIKSLNAAMNNSERAILRSVYDEWRRSGKWRGG